MFRLCQNSKEAGTSKTAPKGSPPFPLPCHSPSTVRDRLCCNVLQEHHCTANTVKSVEPSDSEFTQHASSGLVRKLCGYGGGDRDRVRGHFGSSRAPYPWLQCPFACSSLSQLPSAATLCFGHDLMVFESRSWCRLLEPFFCSAFIMLWSPRLSFESRVSKFIRVMPTEDHVSSKSLMKPAPSPKSIRVEETREESSGSIRRGQMKEISQRSTPTCTCVPQLSSRQVQSRISPSALSATGSWTRCCRTKSLRDAAPF